jgi:hypothetical protein
MRVATMRVATIEANSSDSAGESGPRLSRHADDGHHRIVLQYMALGPTFSIGPPRMVMSPPPDVAALKFGTL